MQSQRNLEQAYKLTPKGLELLVTMEAETEN